MVKTDYVSGMKQLAKNLEMEKIINTPEVLIGGMMDLWFCEKDIEMMRMVMRSRCASPLLTMVSNMQGNEQDYQMQKNMLMNEAYLAEAPAHHILVGLWAMVGKDAEYQGKSNENTEPKGAGRINENTDEHTADSPMTTAVHKEKKKEKMSIWGLVFFGVMAVVGLIDVYYMGAYRDVMLGNKDFISADTGAKASIYETYKCFEYDARHGYPQRFTVVDIDEDGTDEVVIKLSEDDFRLVLDIQGFEVYGYLYGFRSMKRVFTDGTFEWSSGAYDNGYSYARYNGSDRTSIVVSRDDVHVTEIEFYTFNRNNIENYVR